MSNVQFLKPQGVYLPPDGQLHFFNVGDIEPTTTFDSTVLAGLLANGTVQSTGTTNTTAISGSNPPVMADQLKRPASLAAQTPFGIPYAEVKPTYTVPLPPTGVPNAKAKTTYGPPLLPTGVANATPLPTYPLSVQASGAAYVAPAATYDVPATTKGIPNSTLKPIYSVNNQ